MQRFTSPPQLTPGVVTGASYHHLLQHCLREGYALPAVNVSNSNMVNAVLEAAAQNHSDVIIQISHGGAAFYGGPGLQDVQRARLAGAISMAQHVHLTAKEYGIAVILHTDHANRQLIPWLESLITASEEHYTLTGQPLFSSHMLDLSTETLEDNLHEASRLLKRLMPLGIGLEIELGITGGEEDGLGQELNTEQPINPYLYTQPQDVLTAWQRLSPLGFISIAASFGNIHGVYAPGNVKLRPEILKASQEAVAQATGQRPNSIPLVFHGGSGSDLEKIREAVSYGVVKMNLDTDTQFAFAKGVSTYIQSHPEAFCQQISPTTGEPLKKLYDPRIWLREGEKLCITRLHDTFRVLGSQGRSLTQLVNPL